MNRQEFMRRLEQLLEGIPEEEKREAIAYYTSYFEDAGEENEEKIIRELESPEKVAATIWADFPGCNNSETASSGNQQNYNGASQNMGQQNYNGTIQREDNTTRNILLIILLVLTSPIWGGILVAIGGTLANYRRTIWNCSRLCNRWNSGSRCSNYNFGNRCNFLRFYFYGSRTSDACNWIMCGRTSGSGMWKVSSMVCKRNCKIMAVTV